MGTVGCGDSWKLLSVLEKGACGWEKRWEMALRQREDCKVLSNVLAWAFRE